MKRFGKYLAIGLAIAVAAALGICYAVWSLHSMHRIIWLVITFIICCFVGRYMTEPDWKEYKGAGGKKMRRQLTKLEQAAVVLRSSVGVVILGSLVWTIGYGVACWFGWNPDIWEMYLLYGAFTIGGICLALWAIFSVWVYLDDGRSRKSLSKIFGKVLMWIVIIGVCLAVAATILYYLVPLAMASS